MKKVIDEIAPELICQKLKDLRISLGFKSAKGFAEELGVNYTTYRNYEINRMPPGELLFLIKQKYRHDVNVDSLFSDSTEGSVSEYGNNIESIADRRITPQNPREGILSLFQDRGTARQMNLDMVEIEKLDHDQYLMLIGEIRGTARALKPKKKA